MKINPIAKRIVLVFFIIFAVGATGWYIGFKQGLRMASSLTKEMELSQMNMELLFKKETCQMVKLALLDFEKKADLWKKINDTFYYNTVYYTDKLLIHSRVYLIEKKLNNQLAANKHMQLAIEACEKRSWEVCSEETVIEFVKRMNETNPIVCLEE